MKVQTKQEVIKILKDNSDRLTDFGVSSVGLFGSFVREEATDESDVDLLIILEDYSWSNFCQLLDFTESLFERKVDIITEGSITPNNGQRICAEVEYVFN